MEEPTFSDKLQLKWLPKRSLKCWEGSNSAGFPARAFRDYQLSYVAAWRKRNSQIYVDSQVRWSDGGQLVFGRSGSQSRRSLNFFVLHRFFTLSAYSYPLTFAKKLKLKKPTKQTNKWRGTLHQRKSLKSSTIENHWRWKWSVVSFSFGKRRS